MISKSRENWKEFSSTNNKILLFYKQKVLDVTQFIKYHPGGVKAIKNYVNKDISKLFYKVFPHSQDDFLTLIQYQYGTIEDYQITQEEQNKRSAFRLKTSIEQSINEQDSQQKQVKKVIFQPNCIDYEMKDKYQRRIQLLKMLNRQNNINQLQEFKDVDEQKPVFQLKCLVKKQIKF